MMMLTIFLAMTAAARPPFPEVAYGLHQANLFSLPNKENRYNAQFCAEEFERHYEPEIKPLSNGWYGSVYVIKKRSDQKQYILKSVLLDQSNPVSKMMSHLLGIVPRDEVLIGHKLTQILEYQQNYEGFMTTRDWFVCNERQMLKFCEGEKCEEIKTKASQTSELDTQYIIVDKLEGNSVFDELKKFVFSKEEIPLEEKIEFIRSVTFQTVHHLAKAHKEMKFHHFDLNTKNLFLVTTQKEHLSFEALSDSTLYLMILGIDSYSYKVPTADLKGRQVKIIDFGTSRAQITFPDGKKYLVGPDASKKISDGAATQVNLRYLFYLFVTFLNCHFYTEWKKHDMKSYLEFNAVVGKAMSWEHMNHFRGILSGMQPLTKKSRQLSSMAMSDLCSNNLDESKYEAAYTAKVAWAFATYSLGGQIVDDYEGLTYESLLKMKFYEKYQIKQKQE